MNEVSGKVLGLYYRAAERYDLSVDALFGGLPLTPGVEPERFDWDTCCALNVRLRELCADRATLPEVGELLFTVPRMQQTISAVQLVASPRMLFWTAFSWAGRSMFINHENLFEELGDDLLRLTIRIPESCRDSPEYFEITEGTFRAMPRLLGLPDARVHLDIRPHVGVYTVHLPPSLTVWSRLRRGVKLFTSPRAVLQELKDQNDELRQRFAELTEAHAEAEELRREAERARDVAEAALRVKSEFLTTISHEIRTPLNGVIGTTELLLDSATGRDQEYARTIHASAGTLLTLLNDILDFSRADADALVLERVEFAPRALLDEVVRMLTSEVQRKRLTLGFSLEEGVPDLVTGDPGRLRQVLLNLVSNAVKFTPRGEVHARVSLVGRAEDAAELRFEVRDTGIGVAPEAHARIFEPFSQADASTARKYGGTGLGLAICKRLVERMGGEIGVVSEAHRGSTFWFTTRVSLRTPAAPRTALRSLLPLGISRHPGPVLNVISSLRPPGTPRSMTLPAPTRAHASRGRVLVVDDNAVNLKIAVHIVEKLGYDVHPVLDGRLALEAFETARFDAVLMDCQMPEMDGYEVTARIRRMEAARGTRTPVIALTANAMPGDRERCLSVGMDDYLAKPLTIARIREVLACWVVERPAGRRSRDPALKITPATDG